MTLLVSCQSISKSFGAQPLFSEISMSFSSGERLGLIGPNGSGKSTLLKILAGFEQTDEGEISTKKGTTLVYLAQDDDLVPEKTIEQTLLDVLVNEDIEDAEKYNRVQRWTARAGFSASDQIVGHLSGGWKKRLAILTAIILEPDLLLMDEPTNHLDLEGILWLEELLKKPDFAFVLVSHDRYFLENVTNRIIELNCRYPEGYLKVDGSYSDFIFHREAFLNNQIQLETVLANKLRRENEWLQRGPKARTSKARFRIEEAYRLRDEHSSVRQRNLHTKVVGIDFDATRRKTKKLLTAENISKTLDNRKLFQDLDLTLSPGKCLGLLGKNGTGKSTLINLLCGRLLPDEGEIRIVEGVKVIVFDQNREQLDQTESLKRALSPTGDSVVYRERSIHVASWAKRFLFETDQLELPVSRLSGGEQARILIARLMLQPADILLLDEPTNDLDIPSLEVLEESLIDFPGAIVLVTHDRFLLDRLATSVLGFNDKGEAVHYADCNQWIVDQDTPKTKSKPQKDKKRQEKPKTKKLSYKEQQELKKIEKNIEKAELEVEKHQQQLLEPDIVNNPETLQECCVLLQTSQEKVEQLYERWEELEAINAL